VRCRWCRTAAEKVGGRMGALEGLPPPPPRLLVCAIGVGVGVGGEDEGGLGGGWVVGAGDGGECGWGGG